MLAPNTGSLRPAEARLLRARFALPLLFVMGVVAGTVPMLTAPHEANACSGSGQSFPREAAPQIEHAEATERDIVIGLYQSVNASGFGAKFSKATGAHLQRADGTVVPLSRNDFAPPGVGIAGTRRVLVPTTPLDANKDYVLVVDGVVAGPDPNGPATSVQVPFKTGEAFRPPVPTPVLVGEIGRTLSENHAQGQLCCGQSADYSPNGPCASPGKGTPPSCAPTHRFAEEVVSVAWEPGAVSDAWGPSVSFRADIDVTLAGGQSGNDASAKLTVSPDGQAGEPFFVRIVAGAKACVTLVARDDDSGKQTTSPTTCFGAGPDVPPLRTACEDLIKLVVAPKSKEGCLANAAMTKLLQDCPGAPGSGGTSAGGAAGGGGDAGGADAGGAGAGGADVGGSAGTSAGSSAAAGSSAGGAAGASGADAAAGGSSATAGGGGTTATAGGGGTTASPANAAQSSEDGCALRNVARSDGAVALAPIFAAIAGTWAARRRRRVTWRRSSHEGGNWG